MTKTTKLEKEDVLNLCDYEVYDNDYSKYTQVKNKLDHIEITTIEEINLILEALREVINKYEKDRYFDPVSKLLNLLIYHCDEVLNLIDEKLLTILEDIYTELSNNNKGLILQFLYKIHDVNPRALDLFIRYFTDPNETDLNNMNMYKALDAFKHRPDPESITIITKEFPKVFPFNDFRTVAAVELFSEYVASKLIEKHPVEDSLFVIKRWIENTEDRSKFSYAVSGCAALSLINSKESIDLLELAMKHPGLEVRLESAFSQIILNVDGAKEFIVELLLNPRISLKARDYVLELKERYKIDLRLVRDIDHKINNDPDFDALSIMCNWLSHGREYGYPPDKIKIWDKRELFWPPTERMELVYLLKYLYNSFEYKEEPSEGVGYYIPSRLSSDPSLQRVFGLWKDFDTIEQAYAAYCIYELREDISIDQALELLKRHNPLF